MKFINSSNAPKAVGPYSQAVIANNFIFLSGQIGINPKTNQLEDGLENQTKQIFSNIEAILNEAGVNKRKVVKTSVFLKNINDFSNVNKLYEEFFGAHKPARSTIEVSNLPKGALIEIEVIAKTE